MYDLDPTALLERLAGARARAASAPDPEALHEVRVTARRLEAFVLLRGLVVLRPDLAYLRRETARARDLDVLGARDLPAPLALRISADRDSAFARARAALEDERCAATIQAISFLPPLEPARARRELTKLLRKACRRGVRAASRERDPEALHRLRRSARRLRYALEWLGEDANEPRTLQELLGPCADDLVLSRFLAESPASPELAPLARNAARARRKRIEDVRLALPAHLSALERLRRRWKSC